ncbi:MAG TPA: DMT family transporter [Jatrophihabitans sp.]|nr:DMT family transporter [Jatrophihabitans sp.]
MPNVGLVVGLSLSAALVFAASSSLKHVSAGAAPETKDFGAGTLARFVRATVTHRLWLAGIACDTVAIALQVLALHFGALAVVQPLLIAGLVFALVFRRLHDRRHVTSRQLVWALVLCAALAAFVALAAGAAPKSPHVDRLPAVIAGGIGVLFAVVCVALGKRMAGSARRAAMLGIAVGLVYAASAALLKAITDIFTRDPVHVLYSWQLYTAVALGAGGLLLNQLAFQAGPLAASLPATATVDPLASIAVGVAVYDEHIPRVDDSGAVLVGLLLVLGVAVIQLVRNSPAIVAGEPDAASARPARTPK